MCFPFRDDSLPDKLLTLQWFSLQIILVKLLKLFILNIKIILENLLFSGFSLIFAHGKTNNSMATKLFSHCKTLSQRRAERSLCTHKCSTYNNSDTFSFYVYHMKKHPFLHGVGSLGNISGGYSRLRLYLGSSYVQDMRNDWMRVGDAFRESLRSYKR